MCKITGTDFSLTRPPPLKKKTNLNDIVRRFWNERRTWLQRCYVICPEHMTPVEPCYRRQDQPCYREAEKEEVYHRDASASSKIRLLLQGLLTNKTVQNCTKLAITLLYCFSIYRVLFQKNIKILFVDLLFVKGNIFLLIVQLISRSICCWLWNLDFY